MSEAIPEKWQEEFNTGVKFIDEQHRYFFNIVKDLEKILDHKECDRNISDIFFALVHYVEHFTLQEEIYFKNLHFSGLQAHKEAHNKFVDAVVRFKDDFTLGKENVCDDLYAFLSEWFNEHILLLDVNTVEKMRQAGI